MDVDEVRKVRIAIARGWVTSEDVLEVMNSGQSISDWFEQGSALTPEQRVELERFDTQSRGSTIVVRPGEEDATLVTAESFGVAESIERQIASGLDFDRTQEDDEPDAQVGDASQLEAPRYTSCGVLGTGGMGQVTRVRDAQLEREVAYKTLRASVLGKPATPRLQEALLREARLTGRLEHPGIVPIYDVGQDGRGVGFYTMRVVREPTLLELITSHREGAEGAPTTRHLLGVVHAALQALGYAHAKGVVHRDIKPANILVGGYGEVFVIDWGIALEAGQDPGEVVKGTPAYMSPEQARGENHLIDARTDVFAMGVILHEILTRQRFHGDVRGPFKIIGRMFEYTPVAPSARNEQAGIDPILDALVLDALAPNREDRYDSAFEMARALEEYLEGVKEHERRVEMAQALTLQGVDAIAQWRGARAELVDLVLELERRLDALETWDPPEVKRPVWQLEYEVGQRRAGLEELFTKATGYFDRALGHLPQYADARRELAGLYWERYVEAERALDASGASLFLGLVRQYNDGDLDGALRGHATLTLRGAPGTHVRVSRYVAGLRMLEPQQVAAGTLPLDEFVLGHGSYVIEFSAPGRRTQQVPVVLERLAHEHVEVELVPDDALPEDAVVVEGGMFLSGEFEPLTPTRGMKHVARFAIMRNSVTCGEYAAFLNDLHTQGRSDQARTHAPRVSDEAASYFPIVDGRYVVPATDEDGDAWDPDWPICMVSYRDALAYARWRARRDGVPWRLPTALEREKAARGVDGRVYPWGNQFEPSFCNMRESYKGRPMPKPVGSHPNDVSPYGVFDVAGNIHNWTSTQATGVDDARVLVGGSYQAQRLAVPSYVRITSPEGFRYASYGIRLAFDL